MDNNLCKKHSSGYEPLKVIGLNVAGKDCLLCLAEENKLLKKQLEPYRAKPGEITHLEWLEGRVKDLDQALQEKK